MKSRLPIAEIGIIILVFGVALALIRGCSTVFHQPDPTPTRVASTPTVVHIVPVQPTFPSRPTPFATIPPIIHMPNTGTGGLLDTATPEPQ